MARRTRIAALAVVAVLFSTGLAAAQPSITPLGQAPPADTPPRAVPQQMRILTAYLLTIAATSVPIAISATGENCGPEACRTAAGLLGIAGMVFGPSAGHWYAGDGITTGLIFRLTAAGAVTALALNDPYLEDPAPTIIGLFGALALWETGVIWDLATVPRSVRRYNRTHDVTIVPIVGRETTGAAFAGSF